MRTTSGFLSKICGKASSADAFLILVDIDQSLQAEPSLHGSPPQCGGSGLRAVRCFSNHSCEPTNLQPEIGLALQTALQNWACLEKVGYCGLP
jgi:hypothetical protein